MQEERKNSGEILRGQRQADWDCEGAMLTFIEQLPFLKCQVGTLKT